jgi:hypothetical protein
MPTGRGSKAERDSGDDGDFDPFDRSGPGQFLEVMTWGCRTGSRPFDITRTDLAKSKEFYAPPVWLEVQSRQVTDMAAIGTLRVAEGPIRSFTGVISFEVTDVQARCKKARFWRDPCGGGAFNLPNGTGAIGLTSDPAGIRWACVPELCFGDATLQMLIGSATAGGPSPTRAARQHLYPARCEGGIPRKRKSEEKE